MFQRIDTLDSDQGPQGSQLPFNEKAQRLGRQLVAGLYMLLRSSKLYDPSNAIFVKPVVQLVELMNQIHSRDGRLLLQLTPEAVYLNDSLLRLDASSFDNQRELTRELRQKGIFGISLARPASSGDVLSLLRRLTREGPAGTDAAEAAAFQLIASDLAERIQGAGGYHPSDEPVSIDRKKYLLTVYARAIFFLRHFLASQSGGEVLAGQKAMPIVQQLVDLCSGQRSQFVGLTSLEDVTDYPLFHAVNTALLAIVFGAELGLVKSQLRDLGYAALFHDIGRAQLPRALTDSTGALSAADRARVARARFDSVRGVIAEGALSRANLMRITVGFQHGEPHSVELRDESTKVQMTMTRGRLMLYSRLVALCSVYDALTSKRPFREAYGPEVALMLMWTEMQSRFDPRLLEAFVRLMGPSHLELLTPDQRSFSLL